MSSALNISTRKIDRVKKRFVKKNEIKPWQREGWVIPPEQNGNFVVNMEMVLDVYKRPFDPRYPVVCMDESPKQLIADQYEKAEKITLVMDNLNTHVPGSLYEMFQSDKAKTILDRFEFVYTPKGAG